MIERKGAWESTEIALWQFQTDDADELVLISIYRHKLMEKFVLAVEGEATTVESTKINTYNDEENKVRTTFEFVLGGTDPNPHVILTLNFGRIVHRLFEAVRAEDALLQAQRQVTRNSF